LSIGDLFLLPSAQESFGLAALEAMACEVPVIASSVGGLPEIVENDVTGYVFPPTETAAMANKAIELLKDPGRRMTLGRQAAARVRADYCVDRVVPIYEHAYRDVLSSSV
jgi:glycosyltransferase involved in cell wall biosynthesis